MVEFFALSVIRAINANQEIGKEVYLRPDVDAQNAILCEHDSGVIMWSVAANLVSGKVEVVECHKSDLNDYWEVAIVTEYDTISSVIESISSQVTHLTFNYQ